MSFSSNDISSLIEGLDSNNTHSHDRIIILMLKSCGESISKLLEIIFKPCI